MTSTPTSASALVTRSFPAPVPEMGGAGKQLDPKLVAGAVTTLLEDQRYSDSARVAAQELAKLPGPAGAAGIIDAGLR